VSAVDDFLKHQFQATPPAGDWTELEFDDWFTLLQTAPPSMKWTWLEIVVPAGSLTIHCDDDLVPTIALISIPVPSTADAPAGAPQVSREVHRYRFTPADVAVDLGMDPIPGLDEVAR